MQIDWTQTLLGSDGRSAGDAAEGEEIALPIVLAGRMAGMLGAILLLVSSIALAPWAFPAGNGLSGLTAVSSVLVLQVIGFASFRQHRREALPLLGAISFVLLLIMIGAGVPNLAILAAFCTLSAETLAIWLLVCRSAARRAGWVLVIGLCAATIGLFFAMPQIAGSALMVAIAIPSIAMLPMVLHEASRMPRQTLKAEAVPGFLDLILSTLPGPVLIVDSVGLVDPVRRSTSFADALQAATQDMPSLTDALLVVDRPIVLKALSRAILDHISTDDLAVRLLDRKQQCAAQGYLPFRLSIRPIPGLKGRALVLVAPEPVAHGQVAAPAHIDQALVHRAMHDAVSPFNASLGYLELIADPKVAPRDLASMRHYATEARTAMVEAHRNTAMMARWLKLLTGATALAPERVDIAKIADDAARMLTIAAETKTPVAIEAPEDGVMVNLPSEAARFALGVLLRTLVRMPAASAGIRLSIRASGPDVVMVARLVSGERAETGGEDVFQLALEQASMRLLPARYSDGPGERRLVLTGVGTVRPLREPLSDTLKHFGERLAS
ncbi:hypothetical protein MCEMSEM23_00719 [Rhabdaerophilaceae bacterium]